MSAGGSKASGESYSQSDISADQLPFLQQLWGSAAGTVNPQRSGAWASRQAQPGIRATDTALGSIGVIAGDRTGGQGTALSRLKGLTSLQGAQREMQPSLETLRGLMDPTAQISAQSKSLKSGLGELFREELNPAIRGDAIAAGGFGGGRQGVAQGQAVGELADAYTQGLGSITAQANAQAGQSAGMFSDILGGVRDRVLQANGMRSDILARGRDQSMQAASLIPGLGTARRDLGTSNNQSQLDQLQALAAILGGPTVLARAKSSSKSGGFSFGFS